MNRSWLLWALGTAAILSAISVIYFAGGVLTGAMLFTGDHAQRVVEYWGVRFFVAVAAFLIFTIGFAVVFIRRWMQRRAQAAT